MVKGGKWWKMGYDSIPEQFGSALAAMALPSRPAATAGHLLFRARRRFHPRFSARMLFPASPRADGEKVSGPFSRSPRGVRVPCSYSAKRS